MLDEALSSSVLYLKTNTGSSSAGKEGVFDKKGNLLFSEDGFSDSDPSLEETISYPPTLVFFGAGHVAYSLYNFATILGLDVVVIDDRRTRLSLFGKAGQIYTSFEDLENITLDVPNPYYIIFTHGHVHDEAALEYALGKKSRYIGMIGSRKKVSLCYENLMGKGFSKEVLDHVHAPIGLKINAETPEEIALSILSEIVSVYREEKNTVFLERKIIRTLAGLSGDAVLAKILEKKGSGPRSTGTMMIVRKDDVLFTIGGGAIEDEVIRKARKMLSEGTGSKIETYELEETSALSMACGGSATILYKKL